MKKSVIWQRSFFLLRILDINFQLFDRFVQVTDILLHILFRHCPKSYSQNNEYTANTADNTQT